MVDDDSVIDWVIAMNASHLVRHWRLVRGLSQAELAKLTGMQQEGIARIESARHTPRVSKLIKIAKALGKDLQIRFK